MSLEFTISAFVVLIIVLVVVDYLIIALWAPKPEPRPNIRKGVKP
jgi:hypothetical protein